MYKKILLAVDGSENSMRATEEAVKIVSLIPDCKIEVVYVADFSKSKKEILHSQGKEDLEISRRKKLSPIEEIIKSKNVAYEIKILHGEPGPTIIEYANNENGDLVVIGSRGLNSLQEMVLGSVSHKVVKRVDCPVLIVK
ncbi:universal stress protein [Listeria innocua]|uniref:universal stress protein n=1 Tax=Bacillales TaxID=1385 RepID=UPI0014071119|nr:universal stress protein [Listeria innocua]EGE9348460.1 universal stress protein [Listeria monocytogenes]EDO1156319.1 universal stress protein [Listeria innocua]EED2358286.1 universal stress protein [Listeria innocua]EKD7157775.1 universal stress protein [Listeria innocua]EKY3970436.1 universal stress protein [Listeria innocua]